MAVKPMLGDLELELVQEIEASEQQVRAQHAVPALEGDFLQALGRRAAQVTLSGILAGDEAAEGLKQLREKFKTAQPVPFVADIATATQVDQVLIEEMGVRELAGKPRRFEYAFTLREFIPAPPVEEEEPPPEPEPPDEPDPLVGELIVEVVVEGRPEFDFSTVTVRADPQQADTTFLSRQLANRANNVWTEGNFPPGSFTVMALVNDPEAMTGSAPAVVQGGQQTKVTISLSAGSTVAETFVVHFKYDKSFIEPCMRPVLKQVAEFARANASKKLVILGHTDKAGSAEYNQSLSERRARSVFAYLTIGVDDSSKAAALAEWNELRKARTVGQTVSLNDTWGVHEYQFMLQEVGFYPGQVDGDHGPMTDDSVQAYRCSKGLPPGTTVDDAVWQALIEDYLSLEPLAVPSGSFFPNCPGEILKWLGCGEEDPLDRRGTAFRPSRRVELLFVQAGQLPCEVPEPVTFNLPDPGGAVNSSWCLGPGDPDRRGCFVSPHLDSGGNPQPCPPAPQTTWCRQPAEPGQMTVLVSIQREQPDGSLAPALNQEFVLISPKGEFKASERSNGEPNPARTSGGGPEPGTASFADMPAGVYSLEVIAPANSPVLVRLLDEPDAPVKGPSVCKHLLPDPNNPAAPVQLSAVILNTPVLREIRLPVAVHVLTPLDEDGQIRSCRSAAGVVEQQHSTRTDAQIVAIFNGVNQVWRPARIRFDPVEITREAYVHPISDPAIRGSCEADDSEVTFIFGRCSYPDVVNVFFLGDFAGLSEAGKGVSVESARAAGAEPGCAVADRFQFVVIGVPTDQALNEQQSIQVTAHELGHFLNLPHTAADPANERFLMFPTSGLAATNTELQPADISTARASLGASDDCVPLKLAVSGAVQMGGPLSNRFIFAQHPELLDPFPVTIDAQIPADLLARGTLEMAGGDPGANPQQRTVDKGTTGEFEITATFTPTGGGQAVTARVVIFISSMEITAEGAFQVSSGLGPRVFEAILTPDATVTARVRLDPAPFCVPADLVNWSAGTAAPDPLRRIVTGAAPGETTLSAAIGPTTLTAVIRFLDPALPGPFAVGEHEYGPGAEGSFTVPALTEVLGEETILDGVPAPPASASFTVALRALVRYPADAAGVDVPVSTRQPNYPLVILAHGNHRAEYDDAATTRVENFRGLQYLARHLASHGYIAVSIDLDEINLNGRNPGIMQRGHLLLDHIRVMERRNTSGPLFAGRVDLGQIGLIGHSRGGETVVAAQRINIDEGRGRNIQAIVSIAATDFLGLIQTVTPYLVLYGSADGDVSIGWPFRLYDRSGPFKSMIFVYGAIHNFFSEHPDWRGLVDPRVSGAYTPRPPDSADARRISFDNHTAIARGYCLGFFQQQIRGHQGYTRLFLNEGRPPGLGGVDLFHQVHETNPLVVDDHEQGALDRALPLPPQLAARAANNTLGQPVTAAGLVVPGDLANARTEASLRTRDLDFFWHATVGAMMAWDAAGGSYRLEIGDRDVSAFQNLSFRVTQRFGSARNPSPAGLAPGAPKLFSVRLEDRTGTAAVIRGGALFSVPFPFKRGADTKSALKTVRLPLKAFKAVEPMLELRRIAALVLEFTDSPTGEIAVDDIEFTR